MDDIKDDVVAFIEACSGSGDHDLDKQERLMNLLYDEVIESSRHKSDNDSDSHDDYTIRTNFDYNQSRNHTRSVRQVFADFNSETIHNFAMALADVMSHRSDPILPPTQDIEANDEALTTSAISLTRHAFLAAKLYATILAMPGSWGAGFVTVGALSNLSALIRRWCVECTSSIVVVETSTQEKGKRKADTSKEAQLKKKRPNDEDDSNSLWEGIINDDDDPSGMITNPLSLRLQGLELAKALAHIPKYSDFLHWSEDATEIIVDALVCTCMTVAALRSGNDEFECEPVVRLLSQSFTTCAANLAAATVNTRQNEVPTACKSHTIMVYILRGIFSVLSMKIEVPHGQKGREMAHAAAVTMLESIIKVVSKEVEKSAYLENGNNKTKTPSAKSTPLVNASHNEPTPRTGRKDRKKRVSFGTVRGRSIDRITVPSLKEANTPLRNKQTRSTPATAISGSVMNAILGVLQKLVTLKDLDRSDVRKHTMTALTTCVPVLPLAERSRFLHFTTLLCVSKISVHRLAACELIGRMLSQSWFWEHHIDSVMDAGSRNNKSPSQSPMAFAGNSMPQALLGSLTRRLADKAPAVRIRAASSFAEILDAIAGEKNGLSTGMKKDFYHAIEVLLHEMMGLLRQRAREDERATVRKNAIISLSKLSSYCKRVDVEDQDVLLQIHDNIELFGRLCSDTSVAARKAAAEALTELLLIQYSTETQPMMDAKFLPVELAWTSSVLPLVLDSEPSCVNNAVELFYQVIVAPLIENEDSAWRILACISERTEQQGSTKGEYEALKTAVRKLTEIADDEVCISLFCRMRDSALSTDDDEGESSSKRSSAVWCLLRAFTDQSKDLIVFMSWIKRKSVGHSFLTKPLQHMFGVCKSTDFEDASSVHASLRSALHVLSKVTAYLPREETQELSLALKDLLGEFQMGPEIMGYGVTAMIECLRRYVPAEELRSECSKLVENLYKKCEDEISATVAALGSGSSCADQNVESLVRAIYLSGELAMVGFRSDESGTTKEMDMSDPIIGLAPEPSAHLLNLIQALLPKTLPGDTALTPEPARAHAFVALGKLCLRDESFAKECLNLFARELHQNLGEPCIAVQSNALIVLGDLCFKYTNLVDRHLPVMAACLQAGASAQSDKILVVDRKINGTGLVRKHAVLMLSGLLLQDYIKWRGLMFHRFLVATSDSDENVSSLAETILCGPLLNKFPRLFLNNFVESLLVLNKCTAHPIYMAAASAGDNGAGIAVGFDGIDLSGPTGQARRYLMYRMMLSKMSDEEKIGVSARLTKDILGAAVQSEGDLGRVCRAHCGKPSNAREEAAFEVLSDAFHVLTSPWIRVGRSTLVEEDDVDDPNVSTIGKSAKLAVARGRLFSNISRKQMVEIILPILCNLKSILQASCSPLLKELSAYLRELFRAYKTEVKEFLANDPILLQEVEYDAKKFSKSQSAVPLSPGASVLEK